MNRATTIICVSCFLLLTIGMLTIGLLTKTKRLETVTEHDLVQRILTENYLIVLFSECRQNFLSAITATNSNCEDSNAYEKTLVDLTHDFRQKLDAHVVRIDNSHLAKLYRTTKEPALVFFRQGLPLLYNGPIEEQAIFKLFSYGRESAVQELSDENFEKVTLNGATSNWFVLFYSSNCAEYQDVSASWETVGVVLRNHTNVARINKDGPGAVIAMRYRIWKSTEFILIRQGKFYRYESTYMNVKSFVSFAHKFYEKSQAETMDKPLSRLQKSLLELLLDLQHEGLLLTMNAKIINDVCKCINLAMHMLVFLVTVWVVIYILKTLRTCLLWTFEKAVSKLDLSADGGGFGCKFALLERFFQRTPGGDTR